MDRIILTTFTDPMMGLSYECEPVYEQLNSRYAGRIMFRTIMSGLVRDVSDFMLPEERRLPPEESIRAYNRRLVSIFIQALPWTALKLFQNIKKEQNNAAQSIELGNSLMKLMEEL